MAHGGSVGGATDLGKGEGLNLISAACVWIRSISLYSPKATWSLQIARNACALQRLAQQPEAKMATELNLHAISLKYHF